MLYFFNRYLSVRTILIVISEIAVLFLSTLVLAKTRAYFENSVFVFSEQAIRTSVLTFVYMVVYFYFNLYTPEYYRPRPFLFIRFFEATILATIVLLCIMFLVPSLRTWRTILLANIIMAPAVVILWRTLFVKILNLEMPAKKVLIIGTGDLARNIGRAIYKNEEYGLDLVGFIDDDPAKIGQSIVNPGVVGGYGDIGRVAQDTNVDRIIIALPDRRAKLPMSALLDCKLKGISIEEGETFNERMTGQIPIGHLKPSWMVFSDGFSSLRLKKIIKRLFDLVIAAPFLLAVAPLMPVVALLIMLSSRGPVIYRQVRVGENGKTFTIYKFRTLVEDAEAETGPAWVTEKDNRVTRVGRVLRRLRIDELPQIMNILKGDMSFVGPRPERPFFVKKLKEVIPYYELRTVVKPGVTGWAQIKYPYGSNLDDSVEKLQYDIYYIKNMSPLLDLLILFSTVKVVVTGRGAK